MKILLSVDAEGISGVFKLTQVLPTDKEYGYVRTMMAHDVNAAIRGAYEAGAEQVDVNDCHNMGDNLLLTDLDPRARLYSGFNKPLIMAEGLDRGYDALMLIGYHSRKGAKGVVSHTFYYGMVVEATVNGKPYGEADFVAGVAAYYGIPTILLTGDNCVTAQAEKNIPGIRTVSVKEYIANGAALLYHPAKTEKDIETAAFEAVKNLTPTAKPELKAPFTLEITFPASTQAELACSVPGFRVSEERDNKVVYVTDDYLDLYRAFLNALRSASEFHDR